MAGTTTCSIHEGHNIHRYDVTYVADAAAATIPSLTIDISDGLLLHWEHNPGTTVATSLFDVTLTQRTGVDALCGGGANIVTTAGANAYGGPLPGGVSITPVPVKNELIFAASGNAVNSATGVFSFYIMAF